MISTIFFRMRRIWLLDDLDLADQRVLQWVNALGGLLNLRADRPRDELLDKLAQRHLRGLRMHDLHHLLPNASDLAALRVAIALHMIRLTRSEGDAEHSEEDGGDH